jgi:hypothetical protein
MPRAPWTSADVSSRLEPFGPIGIESPHPREATMIGRTHSHDQVLEKLGSGGMGIRVDDIPYVKD